MNNQEYIICAAIWLTDKMVRKNQPHGIPHGFIISGHRHDSCYSTLEALGIKWRILFEQMSEAEKSMHHGFLTSKNNYVDREQAFKIALAANQIKPRKENKELDLMFGKTNIDILISEDLY